MPLYRYQTSMQWNSRSFKDCTALLCSVWSGWTDHRGRLSRSNPFLVCTVRIAQRYYEIFVPKACCWRVDLSWDLLSLYRTLRSTAQDICIIWLRFKLYIDVYHLKTISTQVISILFWCWGAFHLDPHSGSRLIDWFSEHLTNRHTILLYLSVGYLISRQHAWSTAAECDKA